MSVGQISAREVNSLDERIGFHPLLKKTVIQQLKVCAALENRNASSVMEDALEKYFENSQYASLLSKYSEKLNMQKEGNK